MSLARGDLRTRRDGVLFRDFFPCCSERLASADQPKESDMYRLLDNLAPVLLAVPFAVAAVSVLVTVFAGAPV